MNIGPHPSGFVAARSTHRRIQALVARGWPLPTIAGEIGIHPSTIHKVLHADMISPTVAEATERLYARLWAAQPMIRDRHDRQAFTKAQQLAQRRGWLPPLAWDDIDLDDAPPAAPKDRTDIDEVAVELAVSGEPVRLTPLERRAAIRILHAQGASDRVLSERLHMPFRVAFRIRRTELHLPRNYDNAGERIAS
jgi:hypothetical protein